MKTLTQIKRNFCVMMVAIVALLTTSCVVPKAGGGPVKNGTFMLNIKTVFPTANSLSGTTGEKTILLYDGESVKVVISSVYNYNFVWGVSVNGFDKNKRPIPLECVYTGNGLYPQGMTFDNSNSWINTTTLPYLEFSTGTQEENVEYMVFRKKEAGTNNYIYFWIKLNFTYDGSKGFPSLYAVVSNGKYQVGSITTGL